MTDSSDLRTAPTVQVDRISGDADTLAAVAGSKNATPFKRGDRISRYVVLEERGRGGMGVVYAAYDPELDRRVALKLLRPRVMGGVQHTDPEARALLLHEAQSAAKLRHPNVTTVHDVGQTEGGSVFLAMEFVDGQDLREWLAESPPWREVLDAFIAAGRGLEAAHAAGIVHRDFKPGNVMRDASGQVMVTDFGLATALRRPEPSLDLRADENAVTADSLSPIGEGIVGTPAYMPPEQYKGQPGDQRSDVFAFCVSLYEGLYGELPFQGRSVAELLQQVKTGNIETPKDREVPSWLRRIVVQGLSPKPEERWESMTPLLAALSQDPVARRHRMLTIASGAVVLIAVGAALGGPEPDPWCEARVAALDEVWGPPQRTELDAAFETIGASYSADLWKRTEARLEDYASSWAEEASKLCGPKAGTDPKKRPDVQRCLDLRRTEYAEVIVLLSAAEPEVLQDPIELIEQVEAPSRCTDSERPEQYAQTAPDPETEKRWTSIGANLRRARLLVAAEKIDDARTLVDDAEERLGEDDHPAFRMEIALSRASFDRRRGDYTGEYDGLIEALHFALASGRDRGVARCLTRLVHSESRLFADSVAARRWARLAEGAAASLDDDPVVRARLENAVAVTYLRERDFERARDSFIAALKVAEAPSVPTKLRDAIRNNLGAAYGGAGELDHAIEVLEEQLSHRREYYGPAHPRLEGPLWNLANAHFQKGEYELAFTRAEEARVVVEQSQGLESPDLVDTLSLLGDIQSYRNEVEASLAARQRGHDIAVKSLEPTAIWRFNNDIDLIYAYVDAGQPERALAIAEALVPVTAEVNATRYAKALTARANALRKTDQPQRALKDVEAALAVLAESETLDGMTSAYYEQGMILMAVGRPEEAIVAFDLSIAMSRPQPADFTVLMLGERAGALAAIGRVDEATAAAEQAVEFVVEHGPKRHVCWMRMKQVEILDLFADDLAAAREVAMLAANGGDEVAGEGKCRGRAKRWLEANDAELRRGSERDKVRAP